MDAEVLQTLLQTCAAALAIAVVIYSFGRLWEFYRIRKSLRKEWPGPKGHWFWGHLGMVTKGNKDPDRFITYFTEKEKEFPYGFTIYPGPFRAVLILHHPNLVKKVLSASVWEAPKSGGGYHGLIPWLGKGLLILDGHDWFRHRRLLTSAFHFDILKPYVKIMNSCSNTLLEKWSEKTTDKQHARIEIFSEASLMTLDTILQCLLSFKSNCQLQTEKNPYISSIYHLSKLLVERQRNKNLLMRMSAFYNRSSAGKDFVKECNAVHDLSDSFIIQRRKENLEKAAKKDHLDFLDILLQARDSDGNGFSDAEIRAEIDTFLFEGHDTTASALSWTLYALATHPEHQDKCAEEVDAVMGDHDEILWSHLSSLPYLTRCIKESLRLYPPVPVVLRRLKSDIRAEGKTIVKGTVVQLSIIGVQRCEIFWENPQKFDPDRFTLENASMQNHHAFIPFSAGPRNCIGQHFAMNELKIVLAKALRKFKFSLDDSQRIIHCHEVIYRARGGLYLFVKPRD